MSLSTWPAETLANIRKPSEKERKPSEIVSRRILGRRRGSIATSMQKTRVRFLPLLMTSSDSRRRTIAVDRMTVARMSTTKVADTHARLRLNAKHRNTKIRLNRLWRTRRKTSLSRRICSSRERP